MQPPELHIARLREADLACLIGNAIMARAGMPPMTAEGFDALPGDLRESLCDAASAAIRYVAEHLTEAGIDCSIVPEPPGAGGVQ